MRVLILLFLSIHYTILNSQSLVSNPDDAQFLTEDIDRFWMAFDSAAGKPEVEQQAIFQRQYIDRASPGFRSWLVKRGKSVEELVTGINGMLPFYRSLWADMVKIPNYIRDMRAGFYALEHLYPEANFPNVTFFVWYFFATGSTTTDERLLIAAETHSINSETPLDAIPEIHRPMVRSMTLATLAPVAVHESIHEQRPSSQTGNLLHLAIEEGSADFIAELCTGQNPSQAVHDYANAREAELWKEFSGKMYTTEYDGWRYIPEDRPAGLAYWMGYKICEAYYEQAVDKREAVKTLIESNDYPAILEASGYAAKFGDGRKR